MLQLTKDNIGTFLNKFSTIELEDMVQQFPYFQQAHILLAKKYQQENNPQFDEQLQLAALYAGNRELLQSIFAETTLSAQDAIQSLKEIPQEEELILNSVSQEPPVAEEVAAIPAIEIIDEKRKETTLAETIAPEVQQELVESEDDEVIEVAVSEQVQLPNEVLATTELPAVEQLNNETMANVVVEQNTAVDEIEESNIDLTVPHSFGEWLSAFSIKDGVITTPEKQSSAQETEDELDHIIRTGVSVDLLHNLVQEETHYSKGLDLFIESQKDKHKLTATTKTTDENEIDPSLVTETLARLYEAQKKYHKAINAYQALTLKYPEKSDLFAARINYLKNII